LAGVDSRVPVRWRSCIRKGGSLDLIDRRERKILSLSSTDESSKGLTGGIGRCDVRGMCRRLKQANTKDLDMPCTDISLGTILCLW
jgi:hypothetical protein